MVVFADVGDELCIESAQDFSLSVSGPEAASVPSDTDNLVLKVARLFPELAGASIQLNKMLPVASGIGGGSADAAATFRGLMCLTSEWEPSGLRDLVGSRLGSRLLGLGADIPACIASEAIRMQGIGEILTPIRGLPRSFAVLVNPRRPVSTPAIFRGLEDKCNPPMPDTLPKFEGTPDLALWLAEQRNDLEAAAMTVEPAVSRVIDLLSENDGCLLARMSGSGATCFGLFADREQARTAANALHANHPDWWVRPAVLGTMSEQALPRFT